MPVSITKIDIDIVLAVISFLSCVTSVIMASITVAHSREVEFYSRKDKVREIRNDIMNISKSKDYTRDYVDNLDRLTHDYLDELDDICKRFSEKMILDSDIKNDLIFIKQNPDFFSGISHSPHLKKALSKVK